MLEYQTPPTTASTKLPELHRARLLMLRVLQLQLKQQPLHPSMRTGSLHTWKSDRLRHHDPAISFDPTCDDLREDGELHTSRETFPEGADFPDHSFITDEIRWSRSCFITKMKNNLYASQDNECGAEVALRRLWGLFINGMSYISYLRTAHRGTEIYMNWLVLGKSEKEDFLKSFTFVEQD
jgi:hypothetical protein